MMCFKNFYFSNCRFNKQEFKLELLDDKFSNFELSNEDAIKILKILTKSRRKSIVD